MRVSVGHVRDALAGYGFDPLTSRNPITLIPGYFNGSLVRLGNQDPIAVLRIGADMYESYLGVLYHTYRRVPVGGFVIIDDWGATEARRAVDDFFRAQGASPPQMICASVDYCITSYWRNYRSDAVQRPDLSHYDYLCSTRNYVSGDRIQITLGGGLVKLQFERHPNTAKEKGVDFFCARHGRELEAGPKESVGKLPE